MSVRDRTPAQEAELARLIAEQQADDTSRVWAREISLDATLGSTEDFTLLDVIGDDDERLLDLVGENETFVRLMSGGPRVTDEDIKFWRYLRNRQGWTFNQIADHTGIDRRTVRKYIGNRRRARATPQSHSLAQMYKRAATSYEAGAKLIEIAEVLYAEAGFKTPESCYQALRRLFLRRGQPIRAKSWKHGMRSRTASRETYIAYWKQQNGKAAQRRRARLARCEGVTREGKRCTRWAREGTRFCNVHSGLIRAVVWTPEAVMDSLNAWKRTRGTYPRPRDWTHAAVDHPNFKTVYGLFPSWPSALRSAANRAEFRVKATPTEGDAP